MPSTIKTLNQRVNEAHLLASLSAVTSKDNHGRARTIEVPGSAGAKYQVTIRRTNATLKVECFKCLGNLGRDYCPGNLSGVCRHSIAAVIKSMGDAGYVPRFRKSKPQAIKLADKLFHISLTGDNGPVVLTVKAYNGNHAELYFVALERDALAKNGKY